jgi:hypothetical protein
MMTIRGAVPTRRPPLAVWTLIGMPDSALELMNLCPRPRAPA